MIETGTPRSVSLERKSNLLKFMYDLLHQAFDHFLKPQVIFKQKVSYRLKNVVFFFGLRRVSEKILSLDVVKTCWHIRDGIVGSYITVQDCALTVFSFFHYDPSVFSLHRVSIDIIRTLSRLTLLLKTEVSYLVWNNLQRLTLNTHMWCFVSTHYFLCLVHGKW